MARGTWIETIKDFKVSSQIYSDHLPLEVTVILSTTSNAVTAPLRLLPSLIWRNRESENYRTKLCRNLATNCVADLRTPDEIGGFLTEFITKVVNNRGQRKPTDFKQERYRYNGVVWGSSNTFYALAKAGEINKSWSKRSDAILHQPRARSGKCSCDVERKAPGPDREQSEFNLKPSLSLHLTSNWNRKPSQGAFKKL